MKKSFHKGLALALSLILITSVCLLGGTLSITALDENVKITRNQFGNWEINKWGEADFESHVGNLSKNLIYGKSPYYYNGTDYISGSTHAELSKLTDGVIHTNWCNTSFYKSYNYTYAGTAYSGSAHRMYYDLGDVNKVSSIYLVDANNSVSSNLTLPSFKIFTSENTSGHLLFDLKEADVSYTISESENMTNATGTYSIVYTIEFNQPIDARYIGFEFPQYGCYKNDPALTGAAAGGNSFVLYELAVYGEDSYKNATVTQTAHATTSVVADTGIDFSKSLISGMLPYEYNPSTGASTLQTNTSKYPLLTDGVIGTTSPEVFNNSSGGKGIYYDLVGNGRISKVVLVDFTGWAANNDLRLPGFEVYASLTHDGADLFNASNKVAIASCNQGVQGPAASRSIVYTITFAEPVDARYIGVKLSNPGCMKGGTTATVLNELAVFGEVVEPDYTITNVAGTTSDECDVSKNLIAGQYNIDAFKGLTDGVYKSTGVGGQQTVWPVKFTYDLGGICTINKVVVTSDASNYGGGELRLGEYAIYISDSADDLFNQENLVANVIGKKSNYGAGQNVKDVIEFAEDYDTTGSFFGISIISPSLNPTTYYNAQIHEIEVMGTKQASVTATAGEGGTISPEGETVLNGTPIEYTFTPDEGYKLASVVVNGVVVENITDNKYTFTGTEEGSNTIEVTFALIGDTNNDGYLDDDDLDIIKQHILGLEEADPTFADLNGDGDIDLLDLVTAYELQQGTDPAVASLKATLNLTDAEYFAAINRAAAFNTSATATDRLAAVFAKAQNGQPITIAAIGGSITEGAGANVMSGVSVSAESLGVTVNGTTYENSKYVDRVANWFASKFENTTVNKVNAGFSGTPSFLGTFRLEHDVLSHNPDLIIVEFSVNDLGNYQLDQGYMLDAYESVIRKSLESGAAVVAVFTVNNLYYTSTNIGNSWQNYHKLIADHYNIPTVSYHNAIYPNGQWITEWTKLSGDNVHPNVAGHALLANCITSYFEDVYTMDSHTATNIPAAWYHNDTFANTEILYFDNAEFNGMTKTASNKYGYIAKNTSGTGNESIKVKVPAGAKEIYVFYNTIANAGSVYTKLGDNAETGPYSTNVSSIGYSHGEWSRIYNGEALGVDTDLTIRSADDGKALEILTVLVIK